MNPLKKIVNKFLTNKNGTKNKKSNTVDKILGAKAKIVKYGIIAGVAAFFVFIVVILAVISYFLGFVQEMVEDVSQFAEDAGERVSNSFATGCILCSDEDLEKLKEEQFKSKIMVIKEVFGEQVDDVVLASTVLFQGDYYDVIDSQYDVNYNESKYTDFWKGMKDALRSFTDSSIDGYSGITSEEINLIDAATIVMVESNVDGKYNEDSYKHALTVNGFVEDPIKNGMICFTEQTKNLLDTIWDENPFKKLYDTLTQGTSDGLADNVLRMANTADICSNGFIGGTFDHIATIQDEGEKQREKEAIAQNIIDFAKFYRELFPDDDLCVYAGAATTGDITNWRQCDSAWANVSIGSSTVCRIGCTTTAISYIIAKSGTQLAVPEINPGVYASEKSGYEGNLINWNTSNIAPNMHSYAGYGINKSNYVDVISSIINTPKDGKQQFVIVETAYGGNTHWAAVDHVENGVVYALDPSSKQSSGLVDITTMHWWAEGGPNSYQVFYADDVPFNSSGSTTTQSNFTVNKYLSAMETIANDDSHGYSMSNRTGPDYDCSSFIYYALVSAGVINGDSPFTTETMGDALVAAGFTKIPYDKDSLQTGDILVETGANGHAVTIYSRDGDDIKEIAARNNYDGKTGDSGGNEISISDLVESHHYQYIYRLEGASGDYCETEYGSGDIIIPDEFGRGGFTVTFYLNSDNSWNWAQNSNQGKLYYDYWIPNGAQFNNGIAVYEGRYLIACTSTFGNVGDKVDFFLEDGTKIPCIIADIKNPNDAGFNQWGHNNGQNVIEFEVSRAYFRQYGNPGNSNWFPEWAGKRVASATNLGSIW